MANERIERFYKDVQGLDIKFPVSAISKATGETKGNVSKYLNYKMQPSESFLNRFYLKFGKVVQQNPATATETPQNGQKKLPYTQIGNLVNRISYITRLTQDEIADRISISRPHLNTRMYHGDSPKIYDALMKTFDKELAMTTVTDKKVYEMKPANGTKQVDKDATIHNLSQTTISQQNLITEMAVKLMDITTKVIEKM